MASSISDYGPPTPSLKMQYWQFVETAPSEQNPYKYGSTFPEGCPEPCNPMNFFSSCALYPDRNSPSFEFEITWRGTDQVKQVDVSSTSMKFRPNGSPQIRATFGKGWFIIQNVQHVFTCIYDIHVCMLTAKHPIAWWAGLQIISD